MDLVKVSRVHLFLQGLQSMRLSLNVKRKLIMSRIFTALAPALIAIAVSGCVSSQAGGVVSTREILTAEEISKTTALTAYDAIQIRRPAFLARAQRRALRDADQPDARPVVYVNGVYYGEVETLRDIPVREIKEIRFLEANDATRVLGSVYVGGVIMVITSLN
jgi:hypothetical protein